MYEGMGVETRYLPNIGIRLFVFDGKTAVMSSYDEVQSNKAFGICFRYEPVAQQLEQLFEQWWLEARSLQKTKIIHELLSLRSPNPPLPMAILPVKCIRVYRIFCNGHARL